MAIGSAPKIAAKGGHQDRADALDGRFNGRCLDVHTLPPTHDRWPQAPEPMAAVHRGIDDVN
jgi:hypothetical protein